MAGRADRLAVAQPLRPRAGVGPPRHHDLRVRTDDGEQLFTAQEGRAVWLPAGTPHSGQVTANVILCDAFFSPERTPVAFLRPTVVEMTPVLESLLTHLARPDLADAARARAEAVVFDVLEPAADQFSLPVPDDPRITRIVDTLLADPACPRALDGWARDLGISERTVTRAFRESTGLTYGQWRQSLRIRHAVTLLSAGHRVHEVSDQLGYTQPSTFIAAFHKVTGKTRCRRLVGACPDFHVRCPKVMIADTVRRSLYFPG